MKRIFIILFCLLSIAGYAQTKVIGALVTNSPSDTYPTGYDTLQSGGMMSVQDTTARNAIPVLRRKAGMMVFTRVDSNFWSLNNDLSTWRQAVYNKNQTDNNFTTQKNFNSNVLKQGDSTHYIYFNGFSPIQLTDTLNGASTLKYNTAEGVTFPVNDFGDTLMWIGPIDSTNHEYSIYNGLYSKMSYDGGNTWTSAKLFYATDTSAVLNCGGGYVYNGKIFFVFRNWNDLTGVCMQMYSTSSDHGRTWTTPADLGLTFSASCVASFGETYTNWDDSNTYIDFYSTSRVQSIKIRPDLSYTLQSTNETGAYPTNSGTEPSTAYIGNHRFVKILRNDSSTAQNPYMEFVCNSDNTNQAWTYLGNVNMHSIPYVVKYVSPRIKYCRPLDVAYIVASGRNIVNCTNCKGAKDDSIKILTGISSVVFADASKWQQSCALQVGVTKGDLIDRAYPTLAQINAYQWVGLIDFGIVPITPTVSFPGAGVNIQQSSLYKFEVGFTSSRTGNMSSIIHGTPQYNKNTEGTDINAARQAYTYSPATNEITNNARAYDATNITTDFSDATGDMRFRDSNKRQTPVPHGNPVFGESIVWTKVGNQTYPISRPIQALNHIWIDTTVGVFNNMALVYIQGTGKWTPVPLMQLALGHNDLNNKDTALGFVSDSTLSKSANHLFSPERGTNLNTINNFSPSGTGTQSLVNLYTAADITNAGQFQLWANSTAATITAGVTGAGTAITTINLKVGANTPQVWTTNNTTISKPIVLTGLAAMPANSSFSFLALNTGNDNAQTATISQVLALPVVTATDANTTIAAANEVVKLPVITANRNLIWPSPASGNTGTSMVILYQNTSGTFNWTNTTNAPINIDGSAFTFTIGTPKRYVAYSDGTNWYIQ
jgi:hypothetical protein